MSFSLCLYFLQSVDSWHHELSENVWVEGTLRLEYGKSGIYNNNRLPAKEKKKKKKKKKKIPGIGRHPMGPTITMYKCDDDDDDHGLRQSESAGLGRVVSQWGPDVSC